LRHGIEKDTNTEEALEYSEVLAALYCVLALVKSQPKGTPSAPALSG
jgi:hypothetical protein